MEHRNSSRDVLFTAGLDEYVNPLTDLARQGLEDQELLEQCIVYALLVGFYRGEAHVGRWGSSDRARDPKHFKRITE